MTIAGQLSVTASDDPRFKAGDSIGLVIEASCVVTTATSVEVSAPVNPPAPAPAAPADELEGAGDTDAAGEATETTTPATA